MSEPVTCFMVDYTETGRLFRRRYSNDFTGCGGSYHNARLDMGEIVPDPVVDDEYGRHLSFVHTLGTPEERADGRWPVKCDRCPYVFTPEDHWQIGCESIYKERDGGRVATLRSMPAGAMFDAWWLGGDSFAKKREDGLILTVKLPNGIEWCIDCPSRDGGYWDRTGVAPKITARPSISTPGYHGWLTDGVLTEVPS